DNLAQQFETLASSLDLLKRQAGCVAAGPRQTGDQAGADRVRRRENNGNDRRRLLDSRDSGSRRCDNNIDLAPDEFGRDLGDTLLASLRPSIFDCHSASIDPTEFAQPLHKSGGPFALGCPRARAQISDGRQLARLLRPRRERPRCCRAAEQRDELAPLHSITSSASASSLSGIVRLSALAVVRLKTRSNLAGCSTGMSPGVAPRRILSTSSAARRNKAGMFGP